jgi:hypothetical protein
MFWTTFFSYSSLARLNFEDVSLLEEMGQDPEVTPGLFQGDLALTDEVKSTTIHEVGE